jgi:hypothetical protein
VGDLFHGTGDEGRRAFPPRLTQDAQPSARRERGLAHGFLGKRRVNFLQRMVEGKVTRNPISRALMQDELAVFFRNSNCLVAQKPAPRAVGAASPMKNLPAQESFIEIDRAGEVGWCHALKVKQIPDGIFHGIKWRRGQASKFSFQAIWVNTRQPLDIHCGVLGKPLGFSNVDLTAQATNLRCERGDYHQSTGVVRLWVGRCFAVVPKSTIQTSPGLGSIVAKGILPDLALFRRGQKGLRL